MKIKVWAISILTAVCVTAHAAGHVNTVFQVATVSSLTQGVYDGDFSYSELMQHGNFGVGTFRDLDGEMVAVDGNFYKIDASGKLTRVKPNDIVPFAEVTNFKEEWRGGLKPANNYRELAAQLMQSFANQNIPFAIRIDGLFNSLKLRSLRKQGKPYPVLTKAAANQAIFNLKRIKGTIVGFWFPKYWAGIAVPGFHLHFVDGSRSIGGHILELNMKSGQVKLDSIHHLQVYMPFTKSFSKADLSSGSLRKSIKKAEGGAS